MTATLFSYFNLNKEPPIAPVNVQIENFLKKPTNSAKSLAAKLLSENVRSILNVQTISYQHTGVSHTGNTIKIGLDWTEEIIFSKKYSEIVAECVSKAPTAMASWLKGKTADELKIMKLESDKYVGKVEKSELSSLIQEEAAKIVNEKLSPQNTDGIKWLTTFGTYLLSSHVFSDHISLPLTALAYFYTSTFCERTSEFESDNFIKSLPMSDKLRQYLKRQLLHTLLIKYAPQTTIEKVQSYLISHDGKNILDFARLSYHQPLVNRLQRLA